MITLISTYVNGVLANVAKKHAYETRWDMATRLEAERIAAEAENEGDSEQ